MKNENNVLSALKHYKKQHICICRMSLFSVMKNLYKQRVNLPKIQMEKGTQSTRKAVDCEKAVHKGKK